MKNVGGLIIKAAVTMILVACAGQSSDPLKDYDKKDLNLQPKHDKQSDAQTYAVDLFSVEIVGTNEKNYGNFVEGKQGELQLRVIPKVGRIENPKFEILNFPSANEPKVIRVAQDTYKLVWTPGAGTIDQSQTSAEINFQVNVTANGQVDEVKTLFLVSRTNLAPKIKGTSGLDVKAEEGQTVQFTVDIEDPNYNGVGIPKVIFTPYMNSNIEAFKANGSTLIFQNYKQKQNPVQLGQNTFRWFYEMKLDKLPDLLDSSSKVDPNAYSVDLCFDMEAKSVVKTLSGEAQHCLKNVKYKAQPAKVSFESAERKVIAGQANSIKFTVSSDDKVSVVSVKNKSEIEKKFGKDSLKCGDAANSVACEITWAPACNSKIATQKLVLQLDSSLNGKSKATSADADFAIDKSACEAQAAAKIEADKKAKEDAAAQAAAKKTETQS